MPGAFSESRLPLSGSRETAGVSVGDGYYDVLLALSSNCPCVCLSCVSPSVKLRSTWRYMQVRAHVTDSLLHCAEGLRWTAQTVPEARRSSSLFRRGSLVGITPDARRGSVLLDNRAPHATTALKVHLQWPAGS